MFFITQARCPAVIEHFSSFLGLRLREISSCPQLFLVFDLPALTTETRSVDLFKGLYKGEPKTRQGRNVSANSETKSLEP